jgi:hypothetical protein
MGLLVPWTWFLLQAVWFKQSKGHFTGSPRLECESGLKQVTSRHGAASASAQPTTQQADKTRVNMTTAVRSNCGAVDRMLIVMCSNWQQVKQTTTNVPCQPTINMTTIYISNKTRTVSQQIPHKTEEIMEMW